MGLFGDSFNYECSSFYTIKALNRKLKSTVDKFLWLAFVESAQNVSEPSGSQDASSAESKSVAMPRIPLCRSQVLPIRAPSIESVIRLFQHNLETVQVLLGQLHSSLVQPDCGDSATVAQQIEDINRQYQLLMQQKALLMQQKFVVPLIEIYRGFDSNKPTWGHDGKADALEFTLSRATVLVSVQVFCSPEQNIELFKCWDKSCGLLAQLGDNKNSESRSVSSGPTNEQDPRQVMRRAQHRSVSPEPSKTDPRQCSEPSVHRISDQIVEITLNSSKQVQQGTVVCQLSAGKSCFVDHCPGKLIESDFEISFDTSDRDCNGTVKERGQFYKFCFAT
jgi:hypothetical protein